MEEDGPHQAKELLHCISETLPMVLRRVDLASGALPSLHDFHFYNNFKQFQEPVRRIQERVVALLGDVASSGIVPQGLEWSADEDESYNWFVGFQDEVLERVDCAIDEYKTGGKEQQSPAVVDPDMGFQRVTTRRSRVGKHAGKEARSDNIRIAPTDKKGGNRCPVPFHVRSIPKPQDKFDVPVDNSNTPFRHPPSFRRVEKTEEDITGSKEKSESAEANESPESFHPLEEELRRMDYVNNWLLDVKEPEQPRPMSETPFTMVDSLAALKNVAAKLLCECEIAVDLENHQYRSFQGFTCLMQISTRMEDFIVDTLELRSFIGPYLGDIFANPNIEKVMHGADWDITWLQRDFGIYVCNLFDTGQASRVLEMESYGLAYLLENFCGVQPDKRYQLADWRIRPLPQEMLKYAREDTHYLLYVHDVLKQKLIAGRHDGLEAHDPLLEVYMRSRDVCLKRYEKELLSEHSYLQVYGLLEKQFEPEQLAVLAALHAWRDKTARIEDESTGYILPNHLLLKLAEEMPARVSKLCSMLSARHSLVARNASTLCEIISESRKQCLLSMPAACHSVIDKEKQTCDVQPSIQEEKGSSVTEVNIHDIGSKARSATIKTSLVNEVRDDCNMRIVDMHETQKNLSDGDQIVHVIDDSHLHLMKENGRYRQSDVISLPNETFKQDVIDGATQQTAGPLANQEVHTSDRSLSTSDNINDCAATKAKVDSNFAVLRRAPMSSFFGNMQRRNVFALDNLDHRKSMVHDSSFRDLEFLKTKLCEGRARSDDSKQLSVSREAELKESDFLHKEKSVVTKDKSLCKVSKVVTGDIVENVHPESQRSPADNLNETTGLIEKQEPFTSSAVPALSFSGPPESGKGSSYIQVAKSPPGGLASMLVPAGRKSVQKNGTSIHTIQQVKASLKVNQIKSSVALPFHVFSGRNDTLPFQNSQDHHDLESKYSSKKQNIDHCQREEACDLVSPREWETSPSEYEDIILLESEANTHAIDSVNEKNASLKKDDMGILSNSSDDKSDAIRMKLDLPPLIYKSYQQAGQEENERQTSATFAGLKDSAFGETCEFHNEGRQASENGDYIKKLSTIQLKANLRTDYITAAGQEKETQGLWEPLDCADVRKCMNYDVAVSSSDLYEGEEVPKTGKENLFSGDGRNACFQRSETAFDLPRLDREEFRLGRIQPVGKSPYHRPCLDSEERNAAFMMAARPKGIITSSTGKHHRGWWPCVVDSICMLPNDTSDEQAKRTDSLGLPLSISQLHCQSGQERKRWQDSRSFVGSMSSSSAELQGIHKGWRSIEKRGQVEDERSYHPLHTDGLDYTASTRQREEKQAPWEPYNYEAAKKHMELDTAFCFSDLFEERAEPNHGKGHAYRKVSFQSSETAFDPLRRFSEESRPEGIQPAKRRQVFPQSGNRTGFF